MRGRQPADAEDLLLHDGRGGFELPESSVDLRRVALLFGEKGRHVRSAVGVASLPLNAPVELELVVEVTTG